MIDASVFSTGADELGHGVVAALDMVRDTAWALIVGFAASGAIQAFAHRGAIERRLGDHRPAAVARASLYGAGSSSCSYAASAMAHSLYEKGADLTTSVVFMVASTNLVIELGLVGLVLLGWPFLLAEGVGGVVMILLLMALGGVVFSRRVPDRNDPVEPDPHGGHHHMDEEQGHGGHVYEPVAEALPRWRTLDGWGDAAGFALGDVKMLWRELLVGYLAAGLISALVPLRVWHALFLGGHGVAASLENAAIGPLLALASCVCSVGNVPLAAALWHGGISSSGVVAFVFGDLITLPLLFIYRRYYGWRPALRLVGTLYGVMVVGGLVVGALFSATHLGFARHAGTLGAGLVSTGATWTGDAAALVLAAVFVALAARRARSGRLSEFATDPVCGMQVHIATAVASAIVDQVTYYFCSTGCRDHFLAGASNPHHDEDTALSLGATRRATTAGEGHAGHHGA